MLRERAGGRLRCAAAILLSLKGVRLSGVGEWEIAEMKSLTPSYILVSLSKAQ